MNEQLDRMEHKLLELETKIDATFVSAEKMRKIFTWTAIGSVIAILIPALIIPFVAGPFLQSQGVGTSGELNQLLQQ